MSGIRKQAKIRSPINATSILMSENGRNCLTSCYTGGESFFHPITLQKVLVTRLDAAPREKKYDGFCATDPFGRHATRRDGKGRSTVGDDDNTLGKCDVRKNPTSGPTFLFFNYAFDAYMFLNGTYGIKTYKDAIDIMNNEKYPSRTMERIRNNALKAFIPKKQVISDDVIDYHYEYLGRMMPRAYIGLLEREFGKGDYVPFEEIFTREFAYTCIRNFIAEYRETITLVDDPIEALGLYVYDKMKPHAIKK